MPLMSCLQILMSCLQMSYLKILINIVVPSPIDGNVDFEENRNTNCCLIQE